MPKKLERTSPKPGAVFEKTYRGERYTLTVVVDGGAIAYKVGGTIYGSPTAAAKAITKTEINGWRFWRMNI